jgi:hypothetical protein
MLTRFEAFAELRENTELAGLDEESVAACRDGIRDVVARQLRVVEDFVTGSYRRRTLIGPLNSADVDVVVVLHRGYRKRGPTGVLDLVADVLQAEYQNGTAISGNGLAVSMPFGDFLVDVIPAFTRPWWAVEDVWDFCDAQSERWILTNPKRHVQISDAANKVHSGQLVPRIRQLKAWNRTAGEPLRSFHLEALAWSVFGRSSWWHTRQTSDWGSALFFFREARRALRHSLRDPAGTAKDVAAYLHGSALDLAVSEVEQAHQLCMEAEEACEDGDLEAMHEAYAGVFGYYYPS